MKNLLKRAIQAELENPLAKAVLSGQFPDGSTIRVSRKDGEAKLSFGRTSPKK